MKNDSYFINEQYQKNYFNNDDYLKIQKQQIFAQQQREDYQNYMKKKQDYIQNMYYDKNILNSPIKITNNKFNINEQPTINNQNIDIQYTENPYLKYQNNQNYNNNRNTLKNNNIMNLDYKIQNLYKKTPYNENKEISKNSIIQNNELNKKNEYEEYLQKIKSNENLKYNNYYQMQSIGSYPAPKIFPELYAPNMDIINKYAKEMEDKRIKKQIAFEEMQLPLLQQGKYLSPLIKPIPKTNLKPGELPFDRRLEERQEYLENKMKNNATYANLTHRMTNSSALKTTPLRPICDSDKEKIYQMQLKEEKMRRYKETLDEQIRNKPFNSYSKENNDYRREIPPDPFSRGYLNVNTNSNIVNNTILNK